MTRARRDAGRAGFTEDGRRYVVRDVHLMDAADSYLWNDEMFLQIDHRGRCDAEFVQPDTTFYSGRLRCFYVRDDETGRFWSAPYEPVGAEPDEFEFSAGISDIRWRVVKDGLEVSLRVVIPRDDLCELWTATVRNVSRRHRKVSLYSFMPFARGGFWRHEGYFDRRLEGIVFGTFPNFNKVRDYARVSRLRNKVFCVADRTPTSYEANLNDFQGFHGLSNPDQLHRRRLARGDARLESAAAVFQFARNLRPRQSRTVNLVFGPVRDLNEMLRLKGKYLSAGGIEKALKKIDRFLGGHRPCARVETPDADFNHYVNHWLPNQTLYLGRTLRMSRIPGSRNVVQYAAGVAGDDPAQARAVFVRVFRAQESSGWLPMSIPMVEGISSDYPPHKDSNVWAPFALELYLAETGDTGVLDERIPFADDPKGATLYEHVWRGLEWLLRDRTRRGLSRIGEGDWNDPLNMAGWKGRGESVWLTEALAFALDRWAEVAELVPKGSGRARRCRREADLCRSAVNSHAWDGEWYARGTTDAGRFFGVRTEREGRIFLNAQAWAIMCGAAAGRRIDACIEAVRRHLDTPAGPLLLAPAYTHMQEDIGRLTLKSPGTAENASAYCHGGIFYVYALYRARRSEEAFRIMRKVLTGRAPNTLERSGQIPTYISNYYRGTAAGKTAGKSSHYPGTGTADWFPLTAVAMMLGVRPEFYGLRIDPQLPRAWKGAKVWRRFRGAEFDVEIRRSRLVRRLRVILDGKELPDNLIPVQRKGSRHRVTVIVPAAP